MRGVKNGATVNGKRTPTYRTWVGMRQRCSCAADARFKNYGGRGIWVCSRWRRSFPAFLADMGERPAGTSIDRKDSHGHYEPDNCRWATKYEQAHNPTNRPTGRPGEANPNAKLTAAQVHAIRADRRRSRVIAAEHRVSYMTIKSIRQGKAWTHLATDAHAVPIRPRARTPR